MKNSKSIWQYDGRSAARHRVKVKATLVAGAIALALLAWRGLKARPTKTQFLWVFGGLLALGDLILQLYLPGVELHLEPLAIIEFVAQLAAWIWKKFETLHVLQILFGIALAVFSTHNGNPPKPPMVHADAANHYGNEHKRRPRRRKRRTPT